MTMNTGATGPRWKGSDAKTRAQANPMSHTLSKLQSSLTNPECHGLLVGCSVLVKATGEQVGLLSESCFGQPMATVEQDGNAQWFRLSMVEAFYLFFHLNCLKISMAGRELSEDELWGIFREKHDSFTAHYRAYSHLRMKNWVVRSGSQYGVDFVVYRHHPSLVHSEYAAIVSSDEGDGGARLKAWSDLLGTVRLAGSVAKTLLVVRVSAMNGTEDTLVPSCLHNFSVDEYTISRWVPERCRECEEETEIETS